MLELEQKVALVTGATRGIGLATLLELGRQGATVVGTSTTEQGAQSISNTLEAQGLKGYGKVLNVTNQDQVKTCFDEIVKELGPIDILVNNAGITKDNLSMRLKEHEWDDVISVNLTSAFNISKLCLKPMMKARFGRIINISSVVGSTGNAGQTNYAASKAGLIGMSKSLALEVASRGITVNVVSPGFIDTDMTKDLAETQKQALLTQIPSGQLGQADDVAHAVAFLASNRAQYITGHTLHVNGGMFME